MQKPLSIAAEDKMNWSLHMASFLLWAFLLEYIFKCIIVEAGIENTFKKESA